MRGFWHPHGHILTTDGAFADDGAFHPLATWDGEAVMKLFRERLLARLLDRHAISEDLVRKLLAWRHPGFSAHVGEAIASEDKKAIEDVACYLVTWRRVAVCVDSALDQLNATFESRFEAEP